MQKNIYLVGVDGSEWSERAVERAVNLAKQTSASIQLVHVATWQEFQPVMVEGITPPMIDQKQAENELFEKILQPLLDKYQAESITLSAKTVWGDPVEVLHQNVKDHHACMIFVGRRGRSRFFDMLLGSVANKLAHQTGVPIVLVP